MKKNRNGDLGAEMSEVREKQKSNKHPIEDRKAWMSEPSLKRGKLSKPGIFVSAFSEMGEEGKSRS